MVDELRPNRAEKEFLGLAYNKFYDIYEEILSDDFWKRDAYYRFSRIKDAFSIYAELLNYPPIKWVVEYLKNHRPPMEAEIGSELFKFVRNVVVHFPLFESWEKVWISKDIMNWYKGILRLFWVLSICVGIIVLLFGYKTLDVTGIIDARTGEDIIISFFMAGIAFGLVWLFYALSIFIYKGFIDDSDNTAFWEWVTGKFSPENDPYRKKEKKKQGDL